MGPVSPSVAMFDSLRAFFQETAGKVFGPLDLVRRSPEPGGKPEKYRTDFLGCDSRAGLPLTFRTSVS